MKIKKLINLFLQSSTICGEEDTLADLYGKAMEAVETELAEPATKLEDEKLEDEKLEDEKLEDDKPKDDKPKDDKPEVETYKFGNKELSSKEWAEIQEKIQSHYGEDIATIPDKVFNKIVTDYINIREGSKAIDKRHQENADTRKTLQVEKEEFEQQKQKFETEKAQLEAQLEKLNNDKAELEKLKTKDALEIEDESERMRTLIKQEAADDKLSIIAEKSEGVSAKLKKLQEQETGLYVLSLIKQLQGKFPELQTNTPIETILDTYKTTGKWDNVDELRRAKRVHKILSDYWNDFTAEQKKVVSIENYYEIEKVNLPEIAVAPPPASKVIDITNTNLKDLFRKVAQKQKDTPPNPKGGNPTESTVNSQKGADKPIDPKMQEMWGDQ